MTKISLFPKPVLWQVIPRFRGINSQYFRKQELDKLKTGGANFIIMEHHMQRVHEYEERNNCELVFRADDSCSVAYMKQYVHQVKGKLDKNSL